MTLCRFLANAITICLLLCPTIVNGDSILFTAEGDIALDNGVDNIGLDGATFTFDVYFDSNGTYVDLFGLPAIASTSNLLTIAGASINSTNGSFSETFGVNFFPTFPGQFFGGPDGGGDAEFNGTEIVLTGNLSDDVTGVGIGDQIDIAHFGTVLDDTFPGPIFSSTTGEFNVVNFSVSASIVPEPTSLFVLVSSGLMAISRRNRSSARA